MILLIIIVNITNKSTKLFQKHGTNITFYSSVFNAFWSRLIQQFALVLVHPHSPVHTACDSLHLQRRIAQPVAHQYETISKQALGIGSSIINTETSRSSANALSLSPLGSEAPVSECAPDPTPRFGSVVSPSVA